MWKKGVIIIMFIVSVVGCSSFLSRNSEGTPTTPRCAIIIVSDFNGYNDHELKKADEFYQYLMDEGYNDDEIYFLTDNSREDQDQEPNITNIQSAFSWLNNTSEPSSQPVVYISDHVTWVLGNVTLQFSDGNISASSIDSLIDTIEFNKLTMVINGNLSGLAGPSFSDSKREIFCSMNNSQSYSTDLFNITRGLNDQTSDIDQNGEVSYYEAFMKECYNLRFEDQDPQRFYT